MIHLNKKYVATVTSFDFDQPQTLEVAIRNTNKNSTEKFEVVQNVTLDNEKTQRVEFDVRIKSRTVLESLKLRFFFAAQKSTGSRLQFRSEDSNRRAF